MELAIILSNVALIVSTIACTIVTGMSDNAMVKIVELFTNTGKRYNAKHMREAVNGRHEA